MTRSDDDILELLANDPVGPLRLSPSNIEANSEWSISTVRRRMAHLLEASLVRKFDPDSGIYEITEKGLAYLDGTLDKEDLHETE